MNESSFSTPAEEFEARFEELVERIARGEFRHPYIGGLFHETMGPLQCLFTRFWSTKRALDNPPAARGKLWRYIFGEEPPTPDQEDAAARFKRCWLALAVGFGWFKCLELEDACLRTSETWSPAFRKHEIDVWLQRAERIKRVAGKGLSAVQDVEPASGQARDV